MIASIPKKLAELPQISDKGYKIEEFIYNNYGENHSLRYGCVYKKENEKYLFLKEENKDLNCLDFLENTKIRNLKVYYGHIPSFPLARNIIEASRIYFSWLKDGVIHTLVKLGNVPDASLPSISDVICNSPLVQTFDYITGSKKNVGNLPFFDLIKYAPKEFSSFRLTTLYLVFSYFSNDLKEILVVLRGNYMREKQENVFINSEMGFSYEFSEKFFSLCKDFKKENEVYEIKTNNICECSYINPKEKFYIKCKNNETSVEFKDEIKNIISELLKQMKKYSCVEETLKLSTLRK